MKSPRIVIVFISALRPGPRVFHAHEKKTTVACLSDISSSSNYLGAQHQVLNQNLAVAEKQVPRGRRLAVGGVLDRCFEHDDLRMTGLPKQESRFEILLTAATWSVNMVDVASFWYKAISRIGRGSRSSLVWRETANSTREPFAVTLESVTLGLWTRTVNSEHSVLGQFGTV